MTVHRGVQCTNAGSLRCVFILQPRNVSTVRGDASRQISDGGGLSRILRFERSNVSALRRQGIKAGGVADHGRV